MTFPLVNDSEIRDTESGSRTYASAKLLPDNDPDITRKIADDYARLVQKYPEYNFAIVYDEVEGVINIGWSKAT